MNADACRSLGKDYLEHYGVKGMKWGVRRTAEQLGHKVSKTLKSEKTKKILKKAVKVGGAAAAITATSLLGSKVLTSISMNMAYESLIKSQASRALLQSGRDAFSKSLMRSGSMKIRDLPTLTVYDPYGGSENISINDLLKDVKRYIH